jgi:glucose/arabinose dehydrogenase
VALVLLAGPGAARAALPPGFQESVAFSGLDHPTALRFSPDGRIFVAEKSGRIKVFDNLSDTTPTLFADLSTNVYDFWDRGLLGLALDPDFPTKPYVYVLYTYDHELGSPAPAPRWGTPGVLSDPCPTPPGPTADGCVVSGRLSRLQASGNVMLGGEQVLIEDWCQQYPSHSIGSLAFGADGALYVSGGDGASFNFVDYGQDGNPLNPCGDPPGGSGSVLSPPTAEGGALRSQDLRTSGDPVSLDGTILRVDPATGAGLPDNPLALSTDANTRRIIAYGLRNPFRINVRPGTNEVWVGDVGWNDWEEINRLVDPGGLVENFGWPCYEGQGRQSGYDGANLNVCENLYGQAGAVTSPHFAYHHSNKVVPNETCPTGSSSVAGIAFSFYQGGPYPASYDGALFFADYSRDCIWAMRKDANGIPAPGLLETFVAPAANPVDLRVSPAGELFYADFDGGTIRRIRFNNQAPTAVATANPTSGAAPLTVAFDGSGSTDPTGDPITHAWDLDGDGLYDDSTAVQPTYTYTQSGSYTARLRVTDSGGASSISDPIVITVGNTPPTASIISPAAGTTWKVGDVITFSGSGTDTQDGTLPASALSWSLILQHCPSNCHSHPLQTFDGVAGGSFTTPDHEYPSYLELRLTATDSGGLTDTKTIRLDPKTVSLTLSSSPGGFALTLNGTQLPAPFTRTVIQGSTNTISAPSPQTKAKKPWQFNSWSDSGAQTHPVTVNSSTTYVATFKQQR